jgi:general secretion pathway protein B
MSFILDALRKSENERQRGAAPSFSQVPIAAPRRALPAWAIAGLVLLAALVAALGGAWWQRVRGPSEPIVAAATPRERVEVPLESPAAEPPRTTSAPRAAPAPSRPLADLAADARPSAPPSNAERPEPLAAAAEPSARRELPSAVALAAEGIALPALQLDLTVYYADRPRDRFVIVNGRRYHEGETLTEGPRVVGIEPTGAILTYAGRDFLLTRE